MGLAAAKAFSRRGNKVIMVARNEERLRREAAELDYASACACDISDLAQVKNLAAYVEKTHPDLNWLFLNAGITNGRKLFQKDSVLQDAAEEITVNYLSTVMLSEIFVPMLENKLNSAMIVTTSGVIYAPDTGNATYSASKAAMHSFIQSARYILNKRGSGLKWFELIAPLVDSPFAEHVTSDMKVPPEQVINDLILGLEKDQEEIRPGLSDVIYQTWRQSPLEALNLVNSATGA